MQCTDSIIRGTTYTILFKLQDSNQEPIDITGYKLFFTAKGEDAESDDQAEIVINVAPEDISDPTEGRHNFVLNGVNSSPTVKDSTDIPAGIYYYDVKWIDLSGNIGAPPKQTLEIVENITDRIS